MGLLKWVVHLRTLFPSDLEILGAGLLWFLPSPLSFLFSSFLFFTCLKPNMGLCFYGKSCYSEVSVVCDLF